MFLSSGPSLLHLGTACAQKALQGLRAQGWSHPLVALILCDRCTMALILCDRWRQVALILCDRCTMALILCDRCTMA